MILCLLAAVCWYGFGERKYYRFTREHRPPLHEETYGTKRVGTESFYRDDNDKAIAPIEAHIEKQGPGIPRNPCYPLNPPCITQDKSGKQHIHRSYND